MKSKDNFYNLILSPKISPTLFIYIALSASIAFSQTPCTDEDAYNKAGSWARQGVDDLALPDSSFPRADFPKVLAKAQKAIELIKKANPKLVGVEGKAKRSIRGRSYFPNGALPFEVSAGYKIYYCVPNNSSYPQIRGTVQLNEEKGAGVNIFFNTLGWITNRSVREQLLTEDNRYIYYLPSSDDKLPGFPIFYPNAFKKNDEAIILTPSGVSPFVFLSREEYIAARKRENQREIQKIGAETNKTQKESQEILAKIAANPLYSDEQKKQLRETYEKNLNKISNTSLPKTIKYFEELDRKFDELLTRLTPEERKTPAIITSPTIPPDQKNFFVTEKESGRKLFTINKALFNSKLPRDTIQLISVFLFWDEKHPVESGIIKEFKHNFDYQALRQMLGN